MMRRFFLAALVVAAACGWIIPPSGTVVTPTTQVFMGGSNAVVSQGSDRYIPFGYNAGSSTGATVRWFVFPVSGNLTAFRVNTRTAIGNGGSYTVTIYKGAAGSVASTAASCVLDSTHQTCTEWTGTVAVSAGDNAMILVHPSSGPAPDTAGIIKWTAKFQPTTANDTIIQGAAVSGTFSNSTLQGVTPFSAGSAGSLSAGTIRRTWRMPDAGTVDKLYVDSTAPGGSASYDYAVSKNGSGTAVTTNIAGASTTNNDGTHNVSLSAGDDLEFQATPNGTPTAANAVFGARFIPNTAGAFTYGATLNSTNDSNSATQYYPPTTGATFTPTATESDVQTISYAHTVKAMYCGVVSAPGSGKSRTFTLRVNGSDTAATVTISNTNTTNQVTGLSVVVSDGDLLSISDAPFTTPTVTQFSCSFLAA